MLRILIIGHARHGKDTVGAILRDRFGYTVADSSRRSAEIFLYDLLKDKYGYKDFEECYQDRVNHRAEWFDNIAEYNKDDPTRLARNILSDSDIYIGMRSSREIKACVDAGLFDAVIWVDASQRLPLEPSDSFDIDFTDADWIIDNNGTEDVLYESVETLHLFLTAGQGVVCA